jgi:Tol biopolymer transport system component
VIVGALMVAAFWIVTTGGPFDRLRAQNVPTANPQSAAPSPNSQKDPADTSTGGPIDFSGLDLSRLDLSGLDLSEVNGDVTSAPVRSPDGSRIVFGARGGTIYSMIVQSRELSVLAHLPGRNLDSVDEIEWSPDGAHIAIMNDLEPGGGRLYVMNADGSDVRVLLHNYEPQRRSAWSPDGGSIAYVTRGPAGLGWYAVGADGAGPPREIDKPTYLRWRHPGVPTH